MRDPGDSLPHDHGLGQIDRPAVVQFCQEFLLPLLADGRLAPAEDGILAAGFRLFGIGDQYRRAPVLVEKVVSECVAGVQPLRSGSLSLAEADRICRRLEAAPGLITTNEFEQLFEWLQSVPEWAGRPVVIHLARQRDRVLEQQYSAWRTTVLDPILARLEPQTTGGHAGRSPWASGDDGAHPGLQASPRPLEAPSPGRGASPAAAAKGLDAPLTVVVDASFSTHEEDELLTRARQMLEDNAVREVISRVVEVQKGGPPLKLAFDEFREDQADKVVVVPSHWAERPVWFIGDIHGDLLALEAALHHIERSENGTAHSIVLLGDLVDDGEYGAAVFSRVLRLAMDKPSQVCLLAGNHDEAVTFESGSFRSCVSPADFADWLSVGADEQWRENLGRLFVATFASAPRAIIFPDGLIAAHAGFPHTDLHPTIRERRDLSAPQCLQDFVWTRASRAKRKLPNRSARGCQFGSEDFSEFCSAAGQVLGRSLHSMVRGHDHVLGRFDVHPSFRPNSLLTINTLGHRLSREWGGPYVTPACIARRQPFMPLEVHRLHVSEGATVAIAPEPV